VLRESYLGWFGISHNTRVASFAAKSVTQVAEFVLQAADEFSVFMAELR
jgi:hypothetical protein